MSEDSPVAANLARLREDRGLTQAELAAKSGISRTTIGRIEQGRLAPGSRLLLDLGRVLGAGLGDLVSSVRPLGSVRFPTRGPLRGRRQILAEVSQWLDAYEMLEEALDDRRPNRFPFPSPFGSEPARRRGAPPDPAAMARAAREGAGLSPEEPIRDLCGRLDRNGVGVLVLQKDRPTFFGLSVGPENGGPAIAVNAWDGFSVERWIFTAVQQLGHLLLHPDEYAHEGAVVPVASSTESEADAFASEFLMPEAGFAPAWDASWARPLLDRVLWTKRRFFVSYRTVLHRVVSTGRAGPEAWGRFRAQYWTRYSARLGVDPGMADPDRPPPGSEESWSWAHVEEPFGLTEFDFMETRLHRLVRRAVEQHEISLSRGAEILGLSLVPMRELARHWYEFSPPPPIPDEMLDW